MKCVFSELMKYLRENKSLVFTDIVCAQGSKSKMSNSVY